MTTRTDEEIIKQIKELIESHVKPGVASHGGNIEFLEYNNGRLLLELGGACSGCAGSTMTLKYGIEQMLTNLIPEVTAVEGMDDPFSDVDPYFMNNDPFGQAAWDAEYDREESDESNNREV